MAEKAKSVEEGMKRLGPAFSLAFLGDEAAKPEDTGKWEVLEMEGNADSDAFVNDTPLSTINDALEFHKK